MSAYYNEFDPFAVLWLRELIRRGLIAQGEVDERSIVDVRGSDLRGFTQVHLFAGVGGWSYALRLAGWPDDEPVWTGSCPCQPFSCAGRRAGTDDHRHLWPEFRRLIEECRPPVVFGEQVAGADGIVWLDAVRADLELAGYAVAAADLAAAGAGAFHIRQRLYFVAQSSRGGLLESDDAGMAAARDRAQQPARDSAIGFVAESLHALGRAERVDRVDGCDRAHGGRPEAYGEPGARGEVLGVADAAGARCDDAREYGSGSPLLASRPVECGDAGILGDTCGPRLEERPSERRDDAAQCAAAERAGGEAGILGIPTVRDSTGQSVSPILEHAPRDGRVEGRPESGRREPAERRGAVDWADAEWIFCRDGKFRPVKPGVCVLAARIPGRVGRLRGYGNSIVPPLAAEFIKAYREVTLWRI